MLGRILSLAAASGAAVYLLKVRYSCNSKKQAAASESELQDTGPRITNEIAIYKEEAGLHRDLTGARILTLGPVALVFPLATAAVFHFGTDRIATADFVAATYSFGLFGALTTAFWPLPSLRSWTRRKRIESAAILFMIVSYATHLSWELVWLVAHDAIAAAKDSAWAYPWWAYIDGGDTRYATAPSELVMMEVLSVANGIVGAVGLRWWFRSGKREPRAVLMCMATAIVHLYSVALYYGCELIDGLPNVGESAFDIWIKFGLANAPWAILPWVVLRWGIAELVDETPR